MLSAADLVLGLDGFYSHFRGGDGAHTDLSAGRSSGWAPTGIRQAKESGARVRVFYYHSAGQT